MNSVILMTLKASAFLILADARKLFFNKSAVVGAYTFAKQTHQYYECTC